MTRFAILALALAACASPSAAQPAQSLHWTDADSGVLDGVKFRLADVDAPETGGVGSINGARCEAEREKGFAAKASMIELTKGKRVSITAQDPTLDKYGRVVMSLSLDGSDLGGLGVKAGWLKPYVFENGRQKQKKPDWCQ